MTSPAPKPIEDDGDDAPAWARRHLGMLVDLGDMGMVLARNLVRRVTAETEAAEAGEPEDAPPAGRGLAIDPALSFTRISRAVRLTIALEARMRREIEAGVFGPANDDAPGGDAPDDGAVWDDPIAGSLDLHAIRRNLRRHHYADRDPEIRRAVEETIESTSDDPDEVERLRGELKERLEDEEDVFEARFTWPIGEAIALICQDLGIEPDWDRWETPGWAVQEAKDSPKGSPYATVDRSNDPFTPGTYWYRQSRRLYPVNQLPPLRAARGPP